jgi:hypothetical protein
MSASGQTNIQEPVNLTVELQRAQPSVSPKIFEPVRHHPRCTRGGGRASKPFLPPPWTVLFSQSVSAQCAEKLAEWMPDYHGWGRQRAILAMQKWDTALRPACVPLLIRVLAGDHEPAWRAAGFVLAELARGDAKVKGALSWGGRLAASTGTWVGPRMSIPPLGRCAVANGAPTGHWPGGTGRVSLALAWASGRHGPGMPWLQAAAGQADRQPLSRASTAGSGTRPVLETTTGITTTDRRAHRATGAAGRRSGITRAWLAGPSIRPGARPGGRRARRDRRPRSNAVGPRGAVTAVEPGPYVLPPFPRTGAAAMAGWP